MRGSVKQKLIKRQELCCQAREGGNGEAQQGALAAQRGGSSQRPHRPAGGALCVLASIPR